MGNRRSCLGTGCSTIFALGALWVAGGIIATSYKSCKTEGERAAEFERRLKKELGDRDDVIIEDGKIILIDEVRKSRTDSASSQTTTTPAKVATSSSQAVQTSATPTGTFTVNFQSQSGSDKQFQCTVGKRNKDGRISMRIKEIGGKDSSLGGMARFNIIFWDAAKPENKGVTFQLCLNNEQGAFVRAYDPALATIYMTNYETVCGKLNGLSHISFSQDKPNLKKARTLRTMTVELPDKFFKISENIQQKHDVDGYPILIPDRATREWRNTHSRGR